MSDWKNFSLGEIVEFNPVERIVKGTLAKKISMEKLQPFCRAISGYELKKYNGGGTKFRNGDTIMARITPCLENGKTARINILNENEVGFGSTEYIVFRAKENVTVPDFVYYLVRSEVVREPAIKSMVGTSGRQRVQTNYVKNVTVKLPPLETQKKIAAVLSTLDDKIELNNAINKNLKEQAQAIFKSCFIDFGPFGGTMPDDWQIEEFQSLLTERKEKSNNPELKLFSVTDNGILPREEKFNKKLSKPTTINKVIYQGDLVFGMSRKILNWGVMRGSVGAVSSAYNVFSVSKKVNTKYLASFIKQNIIYFHDLIKPASREGQGVDKGILMRKKIYLPDSETLERYYEIEDSLTTTIDMINQQTKKLGEIRDALLPRLMSGEFDVSEVEI